MLIKFLLFVSVALVYDAIKYVTSFKTINTITLEEGELKKQSHAILLLKSGLYSLYKDILVHLCD
jgi:hypothetical protein